MKLLYLILGIVLALLAAVNVIGVVGTAADWWHATSLTIRNGIIWGCVLGTLSGASFIRYSMLRKHDTKDSVA